MQTGIRGSESARIYRNFKISYSCHEQRLNIWSLLTFFVSSELPERGFSHWRTFVRCKNFHHVLAARGKLSHYFSTLKNRRFLSSILPFSSWWLMKSYNSRCLKMIAVGREGRATSKMTAPYDSAGLVSFRRLIKKLLSPAHTSKVKL